MRIHSSNEAGQLSIYMLVFATVAVIVMSGFIVWADFNLHAVFRDVDAAQSFMIAESGIEYYRWHLAHAPQDYEDGGGPGPYVHDFFDKDGTQIGSFELDLSPPPEGTTVLSMESTGTTLVNPNVTKTIEAQLAISSFSKYAAIIGSDFVRFGEGTEIFGPIHGNLGVRVDGVAHNLVTSSVGEYNDPDHAGNKEFGVHTHSAPVDPEPPAAVPVRPDVFMAGRQFPVAPVDFVGLTQDLAVMMASAQADGFYRGPSEEADGGYHVILKTNDTFDVYKVTSIVDPPQGCISVLGEQDWDTWTIENETFIGNYPIPTNGLVFFQDHVWVDGQIDTARVSIIAAIFPENPAHLAHITVNEDLLYTNYDGKDVISLIAQGNFTVGMESEDDLRIDAALISQIGRVGRYYYRPPSGNQTRCGPWHIRQKITLYGMLASEERYGFAYSDGTGYQQRIIIYDSNLLFGPPPSFPLLSTFYTPIFWNEK